MYRTPAILIPAILTALCGTVFATPLPISRTRTLTELEEHLENIDHELSELAHYSLRSGIGAIGYRSSGGQRPADRTEWIQIDFEQAYSIDQVVLVPTIWRDTEKGFQDDGFPKSTRIIGGSGEQEYLLASYGPQDHVLPRIAPLVLSTKSIPISWLRIEATDLSPIAINGQHILQFSEIMAFSNGENVALHRPIQTGSAIIPSTGWETEYLVDGFLPYLMDAAQGRQSLSYISNIGEGPTLTVDLEKSYPISRIHLHAVDQSDTVPQAFVGNLGLPKILRIEGANHSDFSDAVILLETDKTGPLDVGPIMQMRIPESTCRFIRISDAAPPNDSSRDVRIGFAEIELFANGKNVALNKSFHAETTNKQVRSTTSLTDGNNLYGAILPLQQWVNELARRHELETERPLVMQELNRRYAMQKKNLNRMSWLAVILGTGIVITILIDRLLRQRHVGRIRERFAADLHDELGANLHAIGLLGDLAKEAVDSREELIETVDEIRALTERSGEAARYCADMQQADIYGKLPEDMRRTARRIMADLAYDIVIEGAEILEQLKPRKKSDLFLFYKESLVNISRHSGATEVGIKLIANQQEINLDITDNGLGLMGEIPTSLKRRARLLGGQITTTSIPTGGTCITLNFRPRKFGFKKRCMRTIR